ncbi:MAG: stage III sporulation protein AD [Clostridiales bacterium]|nr:stage III sporulation protein AD [Candidatus Apopatousia equi]
MDIVKIIAIGLITVVTSIILKQIKPEMALFVSICGGLIMLFMIIDNVSNVFGSFNNLMTKTGVDNGLFKCVLKVIGIGYLTEFGANICLDAGSSSIADKIMFSGKIAILILCMPVITNLINMIVGLMP